MYLECEGGWWLCGEAEVTPLLVEWGYEMHCNLQRQDGQILAHVLMTSVCSMFWLVPF